MLPHPHDPYPILTPKKFSIFLHLPSSWCHHFFSPSSYYPIPPPPSCYLHSSFPHPITPFLLPSSYYPIPPPPHPVISIHPSLILLPAPSFCSPYPHPYHIIAPFLLPLVLVSPFLLPLILLPLFLPSLQTLLHLSFFRPVFPAIPRYLIQLQILFSQTILITAF